MLSLLDVAGQIPKILGTTPGQLAGQLPNLVNSMGSSSLVEYTQSTRISPLAMVDALLTHNPLCGLALKSANMLVASYYLRAVSISLQYNNIQISSILDGLNPTRNVRDSLARSAGTLLGGNEDYSGYALPSWDVPKGVVATAPTHFDHWIAAGNNDSNPHAYKPVLFSAGNNANSGNTPILDLTNPDADPNVVVSEAAPAGTFHKDTVSNIQNLSNLAVGTTLVVTFESASGKVDVPVQVDLTAVTTDSNGIIDILSHAETDTSMGERWWQWRSGLLSTWNFFTAMDLVDQHADALRRDKSGVYREIMKRKNHNRLSGFLSGMAALKRGLNGGQANGLSVATASNIIVLDKATADALELKIGGSLSNFDLRSRIFANSYLMLMIVIDTQWETFTIYHRGLEHANELRASDMKTATKGGNVDMLAMVEAYSKMQTPSFGPSRF